MNKFSARVWFGALFAFLGVLMIAVALMRVTSRPQTIPASFTPEAVREPLVPTRAPRAQKSSTPASLAALSAQARANARTLWRGKTRWGIGVAVGPITRYDVAPFGFGWYLNWNVAREPGNRELDFAQMVRVRDGALVPNVADLALVARANPGSLWLIGNEPDVRWQDNVAPDKYAALYHQAYRAIKDADASAQVAIGGITQPSPLRLRYLDLVLAAYREQFGETMPVDVWNVHNFILREERDSWGVDIPPGIRDTRGVLYEVDDSGNLDAFRRQIVDFRKWMAARGFQNRALIVSEYGIPMPEDYGFPPERVLSFLTGTFEFFLTARDPALGDPSDDYKLVQRWCWFSLDDVNYPNGRLFDPQTGKPTEFGNRWANQVVEWTR